ncbi:efflux transporter outer membrane subunit [Flavobacterium sp. LHD-85]|uniref:TolC family protein n=1 Tax=Flavobacterium sp. LHD-85 TaxID=3071410 RepID=UPI0027E0F010|nr:efflux transporter outer membrane subunit [Flavobacterium sp. LHD-85]MDQ6532150.1 efflux transporter outer membrane subunit [Flavobacterium sp. LHD-85]
MKNNKRIKQAGVICTFLFLAGCKAPSIVEKKENKTIPETYANVSQDTANTGKLKWRSYFIDEDLKSLIDIALQNNQELNITLQEIEIARSEVRAKKGEYLPFVGFNAGVGLDKSGRYTSTGSGEATTEIMPGRETPDPLPNYGFGLSSSWEIDIWNKLHNAKKAALNRYLGSVEGKNFVITNLIAEIANSYYELLALDNQLEIVKQNIDIQSNALKVVKIQKEAARVNELAVRRFEAQMLNTQSLQFGIQQEIYETENKINFLLGRFPQKIVRNDNTFNAMIPPSVHAGVPSQLLENRPDIKKAEMELIAAKLDVKSAKAKFYPSLGISAGIGYEAFNAKYLLTSPESLLYSLAGDLVAPLINRNAIKASYITANAKQIQAVYNYERTLVNAYIEVANQLSKIQNTTRSYDLKSKQVQALNESIQISNNLFSSARADYMEVLLTQKDALESKFELIETKKQQMNAFVNVYRALGGGWN